MSKPVTVSAEARTHMGSAAQQSPTPEEPDQPDPRKAPAAIAVAGGSIR